MNDLNVRRWTGVFGVAGFGVFLVALALYFLGPQPMARLEDTIQFSDSVSRASTLILARATLADTLIMACLLATIPLIFGLVGSTTTTVALANGGFQTRVTALGSPVLFWLAIGMYVIGALTSFVGYIGALIKMARLDQWIWFILLLAFSGVTMLVYIFVGPETRAESMPLMMSHSG